MKCRICLLLTMMLLVSFCFTGNADTVLNFGGSKYETSEKTASVTVTEVAVNIVKSGIFGANTSYRGGGYGFYDDKTGTFNETLLQLLRDSGVTHIRLPGGIEGDYFHWNESVGPVEERLPQVDCFSMDYPTYTRENGAKYVVTFGPDEWFELCKLTDTALTVQLNAGNGTPAEAADFVRYCLDSGVEIESITVGNEVCMAEERVEGIHITKTPTEYIAFFNEVWELMSDETKQELAERNIPFGAIGVPANHPLNRDKTWDYDILREIGDKADFLDIHIGYTPYFASRNTSEQIVKCLLASADRVKDFLNAEIKAIDRYAPGVKIMIAEHGPLGAAPYTSGIAGGIYLAAFFQAVLAEEKVISTDYLPLTNHPAANNLLGYYNEGGKEVAFDNVVSTVFRMYAEQIGRSVLKTQIENAQTFTATGVGLMPAIGKVSEADAAVYYDAESRTGTLFILNKAYKQNTTFDIDLPFSSIIINQISELFMRSTGVINSYQSPNVIKPLFYNEYQDLVSNGHLMITAKPISLLKIDFSIREE